MKNSIKALVAVLCLTAGSTVYASDDLIQAGVYQNRLDTVLLNYENGKHKEVYPDLLKYAKWGEKIPQYLLASMYLKGEGVDQDIKEAYLWLKVAVEQEDRDWLASLRAIENVLPADFKEAVKPEVQAHIEKYGVANNELVCRSLKKSGSNLRNHTCSKKQVRPGYYYVGGVEANEAS